MNIKLGISRRVMAGALFICLSIIMTAICIAGAQSLPDLQSQLKESVSNQRISDLRLSGSDIMPKAAPSSQTIQLSLSNSSYQTPDLSAVNSVKERNILCDEVQKSGPDDTDLVNSLDVSITGQNADPENAWQVEGPEDRTGMDIESRVDKALNSSQMNVENYRSSKVQRGGSDSQMVLGNNLNVDVHGISISALNTAEGGSAVATSNIIIKPVQIIVCPSEVEEKLK